MQRTLNIPDSIPFTSRGQTVTMDATKLTDEILVNMILAWQGVTDAASGAAKDAAIAVGKFGDDPDMADKAVKAWLATDDGKGMVAASALRMMQAKVDATESGVWNVRGNGGAPRDDRTLAIVRIIGRLVKDKKAWNALTYGERVAKASENFEANATKLEPMVEPEIAAINAERKAREDAKAEAATLASEVTITL